MAAELFEKLLRDELRVHTKRNLLQVMGDDKLKLIAAELITRVKKA